jgi:hypothetical protein
LEVTPVVAHRILELKAETAKQDLITLRKAAMFGNPLVLFAAKLKGLLDGVRLARELLSGKADLPAGYASQIGEIKREQIEQIDVWKGLYLPCVSQEDGQPGDVTDPNEVSGPIVRLTPRGEQMGEQRGEQTGEQRGEQNMGGGESGPRQAPINNPDGEDCVTDERSARENEDLGEQDKRDYEAGDEQSVRSSQWLKSILPEALNGWWDIRDKGNGMAIKFRWRDPELQVITPLRLTSEQFEVLKQSGYEAAKSRIGEQIFLGLYNLSRDPARRDKALLVAQKLGIDLEIHQAQETANSNEADKWDE